MDKWVQNLKLAVTFVKDNGWRLNTSLGTPNWEIITAAAANEKVPVRMFIDSSNCDEIKLLGDEFGIFASDIEIIEMKPKALDISKEAHWKIRDKQIIESSDLLIPISIRPSGHLDNLISFANKSGKTVTTRYQSKFEKSKSLAYTVDMSKLSDEIQSIKSNYIFHWTRTSNTAWPGERKIDFYLSLLDSIEFPRTAFNTLFRIVDSKRITASSKNMPGKTPTVSFSGLSPVDSLKLMKWRARYRQMSFEPYGIGLEKHYALSNGVKEVHYFKTRDTEYRYSSPKWLTQSKGKITDWSNENEFRHLGDLDFTAMPKDKIILICRFKNEAATLKKEFGIQSFWFCD